MRVELRALKPNPLRDFTVDPLDGEAVENLKQSIKQDGFWGGVVGRRDRNGGVEVAAGWHQIKAAIAAGIREADIFVGNFDDASMIRVYSIENATQRGNSGTAIAGTVAAAIRFLVKGSLTGQLPEIRQLVDGVGWSHILEFLQQVPGINKNTIIQQLANLKASGDYARIVREVQEQIEEEHKEALKALERAEKERIKAEEAAQAAEQRQREAEAHRKEMVRAAKTAKEEADRKRAEAAQRKAEEDQKRREIEAELAEKRRKEAEAEMKQFDALRVTRDTARKAADKAEEREKTFDFEGVAKHLKNANQIDHFREMVTGEGIRPYLAVNRQAALAKQLVAELAAINKERERDGKPKMDLSARFIRENVESLVLDVKVSQRQFSREEKQKIERQSWSTRFENHQREFSRNAHGLFAAALALSDDAKKRPHGVTLHMTSEFREAVGKLERAVALMKKAGVI